MWPLPRMRQRGAVIILVLWMTALLSILVTTLAANVRLSATTARNHQVASEDLLRLHSAMNAAEMEVMLEWMPLPPDLQLPLDDRGDIRVPAYRFNGQPLELYYPADEDVVVRIQDHAGKISLNRIPRDQLRLLIEKRLGPDFDPDEVQALLDAWTDWTSEGEASSLDGAGSDYYQQLDPPHPARNSPELDTLKELRLIRGFDQLFAGVNLEAAFTIHGGSRTVNLNLATREAMRLLPGLDEELIESIIAHREVRDLRTAADIAAIVPPERMVELDPWIGTNASPYYSVYVHPRQPETEQDESDASLAESDTDGRNRETRAYRQILEANGYEERPRVLQVDPMTRLPDYGPARVPDNFRLIGF